MHSSTSACTVSRLICLIIQLPVERMLTGIAIRYGLFIQRDLKITLKKSCSTVIDVSGCM